METGRLGENEKGPTRAGPVLGRRNCCEGTSPRRGDGDGYDPIIYIMTFDARAEPEASNLVNPKSDICNPHSGTRVEQKSYSRKNVERLRGCMR
jgi:hypothetical protein